MRTARARGGATRRRRARRHARAVTARWHAMAATTVAALALGATGLCICGCSRHSYAAPADGAQPQAACTRTLPLTVIVTTSPCRGGAAVHCALLRALFTSFEKLPGLNTSRILLVCDGYKLVKPGGKARPKGVRFSSCVGCCCGLITIQSTLKRAVNHCILALPGNRNSGSSGWLPAGD